MQMYIFHKELMICLYLFLFCKKRKRMFTQKSATDFWDIIRQRITI